nr:hypothetical protein [uncultured Brachyspira sp.]
MQLLEQVIKIMANLIILWLIRLYLDMLPEIRLYLRYGGGTYKNGTQTEKIGESFGFDFRLYFGSMVEEVALKPFVKLVHNGALGKYHNNTRIEAVKIMNNNYNSPLENSVYAKSAWELTLMPALGLTANSDIVSLYLEPQLDLSVKSDMSTASAPTTLTTD